MAEWVDALGSKPGSSRECEFDSHQGDWLASDDRKKVLADGAAWDSAPLISGIRTRRVRPSRYGPLVQGYNMHSEGLSNTRGGGRPSQNITNKRERRGEMRPYRQHDGDAGADLEVAIPYIIYPRETIMVKTGYVPQVFDIPREAVGLVFARSSLHKRGLILANGVGVIDSGYTGEVFVPLHNLTDSPVVLGEHERIAQIVVLRLENLSDLYDEPVLSTKERGGGGFGSTGK